MREALRRAIEALGFPAVEVVLQQPRDPGHGDLATNVALKLGAQLKRPARDVAEQIAAQVQLAPGIVEKVEVAGPGFINFWLAAEALTDVLPRILEAGEKWGRSTRGAGKLVNVEFVSANPTGPLHVGHGRGAALGDAIASLLEATGYEVTREFYVNDAGVQVDRLARSLWARVQQAVGREAEIPEGGYHGNYLVDLARELIAAEGRGFAELPEEEGVRRCREIAVRRQREEQDRDLADFGVRFDVIYWESQLYGSGLVDDVLRRLGERGLTYERDGALWLRTSEFGDAKDRVLRKSDGSYTYFVPDIAYHVAKAERGFERAIDVWGADHHGYVPRMAAALAALGFPPDFFQAVIVQLVRVMRHGEEVRFSKRSGEFVTLRDLYEETGVDAARYFFLMRRADSQFVFDIDLATKQSEENPVYYVQYAHTRMAGIFRTGGIDPRKIGADGADLTLLSEPEEQELIKTLGQFPEVVSKAAETLEPHRIVTYLEEVARLVNGWYHRHRVLGAGADLERARLVLARAAQIVLANGLRLIGVSAPERM
ncbi:MAG: arginine--tRNA ligase [Gemmatimonadales bacterium]|nr:Arginine--tRNA ligase [bacterium HR33]GIW51280.1 MAG: arginine--tRNA ligase [Gemmatimonadales bacterium]